MSKPSSRTDDACLRDIADVTDKLQQLTHGMTRD